MLNFRTEHDSMGELKVPADALWGAQTQRAVDNFPISGLTLPRDFVRAHGLIKTAAADANLKLGHLKSNQATAIRKAAQRVAEVEPPLIAAQPEREGDQFAGRRHPEPRDTHAAGSPALLAEDIRHFSGELVAKRPW